MFRLLRFLIYGDWHKCNMKFVKVYPYNDTSYGGNMRSITYVKVCTVCGKHEKGHIYGCDASKPEDLNVQ